MDSDPYLYPSATTLPLSVNATADEVRQYEALGVKFGPLNVSTMMYPIVLPSGWTCSIQGDCILYRDAEGHPRIRSVLSLSHVRYTTPSSSWATSLLDDSERKTIVEDETNYAPQTQIDSDAFDAILKANHAQVGVLVNSQALFNDLVSEATETKGKTLQVANPRLSHAEAMQKVDKQCNVLCYMWRSSVMDDYDSIVPLCTVTVARAPHLLNAIHSWWNTIRACSASVIHQRRFRNSTPQVRLLYGGVLDLDTSEVVQIARFWPHVKMEPNKSTVYRVHRPLHPPGNEHRYYCHRQCNGYVACNACGNMVYIISEKCWLCNYSGDRKVYRVCDAPSSSSTSSSSATSSTSATSSSIYDEPVDPPLSLIPDTVSVDTILDCMRSKVSATSPVIDPSTASFDLN